ncbi:Fusaridione A cluster transcription factor [Lachnellula hyalina]|uniref:Fusaridione A cluster transcription factor n=1 Tax=Lachnellula hyalina TaxID=1316788 RepID=A0A8H8R711_9HELO|nr:Fusaridione A cluster transcription factor [Lachnellula hyalina]TVY27994.1 Fusaridione A cluster transcription factor [Lachnellula hyalina]
MAQRLEKMERLISDFALEPKSITDSTSPRSVSEGSPSGGSPKDKLSKMSPTDILESIERPECGWKTTAGESESPEETTPREPYRGDRLMPHLLDAEDGGYNGMSIFSRSGAQHVNHIIGDESFSQMLSTWKPMKKIRQADFDTSVCLPRRVPGYHINLQLILSFCAEFFGTINVDITVFQEDTILNGVQAYSNRASHPGTAHYAAVNMILAHTSRARPEIARLIGAGNSDNYLYNAMSVMPSLLLQQPNELSIGALLSMAMYFLFYFENEIAVSILGSVMQQMLLSGYHISRRLPAVSETQWLHRRRLFWHAYCFDNDLALRLGKPPIINDSQIVDLPDEISIDGRDMRSFNGQSFNFLRASVSMAKLQNKTYTLLYSDKRASQPAEELYASIDELDEKLQGWKENIPEIYKPQNLLSHSDYSPLICITVLHYTYYQLTIAIHAVVFGGIGSNRCVSDAAPPERIMSSVALCVGAARASISLLNYHDNTHPFTVFLINHVSWSVDILFMNILHNKASPRVYEDLELLEMILKFYEKYDSNRANTTSYQITRALYHIASRAVRIAQGQAQVPADQNTLPPSAGFQDVAAPPLPKPPAAYSTSVAAPIQEQIRVPPNVDQLPWPTNNGLENMTYLNREWIMPMGFQPEYWQDPWANVFQDPDMSDLSLQSGEIQQGL